MNITVETLALPDALSESTRLFIDANAEALDLHLEGMVEKLQHRIRKLKGREGLLIKRNFLQSGAAWERFFWGRLAQHLFDDKCSLEESLRRVNEDVRLLESLLHAI